MAALDLNAQCANISEKANAASERIQLAADETRDRLAADAAIAQDKASEAADRLKNKAETEARHDIRALARNSGPVALAGSAAACATVRRSTTDLPEAPTPCLLPPTTPGAPVCARQHPNRQPLIGRSRCRTQRRAQHAVWAADATVEAPHNVCPFVRVSG
jgi:hypothetical protein